MAGTLVKRVCDSQQLTTEEKAAIDVELNLGEGGYDLSVHGVIGYAQEILAGRLSSSSMNAYLTVAERVEGNIVLTGIQNGTYTIAEVERLFMLGELGLYTVEQIEGILGL